MLQMEPVFTGHYRTLKREPASPDQAVRLELESGRKFFIVVMFLILRFLLPFIVVFVK